jgi:hypothetical protein
MWPYGSQGTVIGVPQTRVILWTELLLTLHVRNSIVQTCSPWSNQRHGNDSRRVAIALLVGFHPENVEAISVVKQTTSASTAEIQSELQSWSEARTQ